MYFISIYDFHIFGLHSFNKKEQMLPHVLHNCQSNTNDCNRTDKYTVLQQVKGYTI